MFIDYRCEGEKYIVHDNFEAIRCPVDGQYCIYTGYCSQRRRVRHTERAKQCTKKQNYRKETIENENVQEKEN